MQQNNLKRSKKACLKWNNIYIYFASITIALLLLLVVIVAGGVVSGGFVGNKKNQNISIFDWCYSQEK